MKAELPEQFTRRMETMLGGEYADYLASFDRPCPSSLRINTWKWSREKAMKAFAAPMEPVPWTSDGYYYEGPERLSGDPFYHAGLYYLQEPSAMAPAQFLPVAPGDRVLDLCAAPGGKSTELGARLGGKGLLLANDVSVSRARALLKNLERFGIPNICVTAEAPEKLASVYESYFDRILVDAPCSGEGMFRRHPEMIRGWQERGPEYYAPVQREILSAAAAMLKEGGLLLYSTCTFSPLENEETVRWLLERRPEMEPVPLPLFEGACGGYGLNGCLRLYPHRIRGEGHFLALLRKKKAGREADGCTEVERGERVAAERVSRGMAEQGGRNAAGQIGRDAAGQSSGPAEFLADLRSNRDTARFLRLGDAVCYLPADFRPAPGIRYLRTGLALGKVKKNRFEPSQALAMLLDAGTCRESFSLERGDGRVVRYLKGETIALTEEEADRNGWCLVCVEGYGLGFAKGNGRTLKNKYEPGWRWQ